MYVSSPPSQKQYDGALLDRYRKALETSVQISCRYNIPPLPGRTVILISPHWDRDRTGSQKPDFCLPPDPELENKDAAEEEEEEEGSRQKKKKEDDDKLTPSVRASSSDYPELKGRLR